MLRQHREYPNVKSRHVKKDKCQMLEKALINNSQRMFRRLTHQRPFFGAPTRATKYNSTFWFFVGSWFRRFFQHLEFRYWYWYTTKLYRERQRDNYILHHFKVVIVPLATILSASFTWPLSACIYDTQFQNIKTCT